MKTLLGVFLLIAAVPAFAQPRLVSPEVHPDKRVTFRLRAPNAKEVTLRLEATKVPAMTKDDQGVWSVTTEPLPPDYYVYSFVVDGMQMMDSGNPLIKRNLFNSESQVHVPGQDIPWDVTDVPHGVLHHHLYRSAIVGDDCPFIVYTPPAYDPNAKWPYPVLYLLHGFSDMEDAWTSIGQANVILDRLIADGAAKAMVIVMPLGYGNKQIMTGGWGALRQGNTWQDSIEKFRDVLLKEVMPQVEKSYRVSTDRTSRAIAGLSMGGTQSLFTGFNTLDRFAWIGAFSSGGLDADFDKSYPAVNESINSRPRLLKSLPPVRESINSRIRLLWIACGQQDGLLGINQKLVDWMKTKKLTPAWVTVPGGHSFMVWRRFLVHFAQLLFQDSLQAPLQRMGEMGLYSGTETSDFAYRFVWERSFNHPIAIRIEKNGSSTMLRAVELDGRGGYDPGKMAREIKRELRPAEEKTLVDKIEKLGFWQMEEKTNRSGLDGATWTLEGMRGGKYRVVRRWSPDSGDFRELCLYFLQLSGLNVPEKDIY